LQAINALKIIFAPFTPFSSEKLHISLGYTEPIFGRQFVESQDDNLGEHTVLRYDASAAKGTWQPSQLIPGQVFLKPEPLFKKSVISIVEEERARLGH